MQLSRSCAVCAPTAPCDCAELTVRAQKGTAERRLQTRRKWRGGRVHEDLLRAHTPRRDFEEYDLIIESVAGYEDRGEVVAENDKVKLHASTIWDPVCANRRVHEIVLEPETLREAGLPVRAADSVSSPHAIEAATVPVDMAFGGRNELLQGLFGLVAVAMGELGDTKRFIVRAASCGIKPGLLSQPNGELKALFVIYRQMKLEMNFHMPAAREYTHVRGSARVRDEETSTDVTHRTTRTASRYTQGSASAAGQGAEVVQRNQLAPGTVNPYNPFAIARAPEPGAAAPRETLTGVADVIDGMRFQIKINGREIDASKNVRKVLDEMRTVERVIDRFGELISKAPQVGWRMDYSFAALSGSFSLIYERVEAQAPIRERLLPAPRELAIQASLTFFKLSLEISFGVELQRYGAELVARVAIKISGEVSTRVSLRFPNQGRDPKWEVEGTLGAEASGEGRLSLPMVGSANVVLRAATGLKATFVIYDERPVAPSTPAAQQGFWKLSGKLVRQRCLGTVRANGGIFSWATSREFWGEQQLWPEPSTPATTPASPARPGGR